jgi:Family of unknown function (DUF6582)
VAKTTAEHQHAKVGGGTATHTHAFDPADEHGHSTTEPGLLPLPEGAGKRAVAGMAELSSRQRNNLDASDFAWVDESGGHLPIHDAAHVRNALARFTQTSFPDAATKKKAAAKIRAAAKKFGIEVSDASPVAKLSESRSALISVAGTEVDLAEKRLPFLTSGHWEFPDYGVVDVGPQEMRSVVEHFRANVRGQDLPLCDVDHVDPIYRGLACGWVRDLVLDDPETPTRVDAVVDLNEAGDQLVQQDRIRYTSPTLLKEWTDPATGITYPWVAAGVDVRTRGEFGASSMALTNFPRLKQLGRIACDEGGRPRAAVLAMGETSGLSPARAARLLCQEDAADPDDDGDDDGPVPPCIYQPGQSSLPNCPGFTRWPGDDDGDGTCLMATKGCNGYRAVPDDDTPTISGPAVWAYAEGHRMPDHGAGADPAATSQPQAPPAQPQQPAQAPPQTQPAPQPQAPVQTPPAAPQQPQQQPQQAADARETQAIHAAEISTLRQRFEASEAARSEAEKRLQAAEAEIRAMRMAERVGAIGNRLQQALRTGRIDKAEYDRLTAPERMAAFAEQDSLMWVLESIEARPASSAVPLGERSVGSTEAPDEQGAALALTQKTNEIMAEAQKTGRRMNYAEAAKQAARQMPAVAAIVVQGGR